MRVERVTGNAKSTISRQLNLEQHINRIKHLPMPSQLHVNITNHTNTTNTINGGKLLLSTARPLTPLSPFLNELNENSTSSTSTSMSNRSFESDRFLSIDCTFKTSSFAPSKQKNSALAKQKQVLKSRSSKSSYVCMSPSPSPSPSPKSNSSSVRSEALIQIDSYSDMKCFDDSQRNLVEMEKHSSNENSNQKNLYEEATTSYSAEADHEKTQSSSVSFKDWHFRPTRIMR